MFQVHKKQKLVVEQGTEHIQFNKETTLNKPE